MKSMLFIKPFILIEKEKIIELTLQKENLLFARSILAKLKTFNQSVN